MQPLGKKEALNRINMLAKVGKPFIFVINYDMTENYVEEPNALSTSELLYDFNGVSNCTCIREPLFRPFRWIPESVTYEEYKSSFDRVMGNIRKGNSFLTNLTCATPVETDLTLLHMFHHSVARYKLWVKERFVVFSPETFVRIGNGKISSYPMKGTIDASLPGAKEQLLSDPKEAAEHATITDLIRNDLSRVSDSVTVTRYRYVDELQTNNGKLLQVSSEICGHLPDGYLSHLGDILFELLPAGSVTGAPKCKTVSIINEAETYSRGFYTGVMGYFDGNNVDSAVMIRFVQQQEDRMIFKSGGGITSQSTLAGEYEEMKQKVYVPIY